MNNRSKNVAKTKQKQSQSKAKGKIHAESNKSPEYTTIYHSASQRTTVHHSASQRTTVHRSASERIRAYLSKFNYIQELSCDVVSRSMSRMHLLAMVYPFLFSI
jgi:hypothetical protein